MAEGIDNYKVLDGEKYMWDGYTYEEKAAADEAARKYGEDGFDARIVEDGNRYLVYTQRVVTEIVLEGDGVI